jgi:XTP/dITP diphosphohydrolase
VLEFPRNSVRCIVPDLLVATHNPGKLREYDQLLAGLGFTLLSLADLSSSAHVEESGPGFEGNARRKAAAHARASGILTLADDSGLEVDALGGEPGVRSARYVPGSDADRVEALLEALRDVAWERRRARFRCVIAVAGPGGVIGTAEGACEGIIALAPAGEGGFGYDPVFYLPELELTMAQLEPEEKNSVSHRARAVEAALPLLRRLAGGAKPLSAR